MDSILDNITQFAEVNMDWIGDIGQHTVEWFGFKSVKEYVDALSQGTVILDELDIMLFSRVFKIHCVVIVNGRFWSTRSDNKHNECCIKLAYTGNYSFKEFRQKTVEETTADNEDLQGTGIMSDVDSGNGTESEEEDPNDLDEASTDLPSTDDEIELIELSSGGEEEHSDASDVTKVEGFQPLVKAEPPDAEHEIIELSDTDDFDVSALQDIHAFKSKRVEQCMPYICHLCLKTIHQQVTFVKHMEERHPGQPFKCERCDGYYTSKNGYFKHVRSHLYLKYRCSFCGFCAQFPYQYNSHIRTHTGTDLKGCSHCAKEFAS